MFHHDPSFIAANIEGVRKDFQARRPEFIKATLDRVGIAKFELSARWDQVPDAIKKTIPGPFVGFGLSGGFGIGKTFALVAAVVRHTEASVDRYMAAMLERGDIDELMSGLHLSPWSLWCNWPSESAAQRAKLFQNCNSEVEGWILGLQDSDRLLILDDLGADRATAQDWSGEVLARVIDERLRRQAVTIWTSNLDAAGLVARYGPRTFSRLQALAPVIRLPKMPDLRLQVPERHIA